MLLAITIHFNKETDYSNEIGNFFKSTPYIEQPDQNCITFECEGKKFWLNRSESETKKFFIEIGQNEEFPIFFNNQKNVEKIASFLSQKFQCYVEAWYGKMESMEASFEDDRKKVNFKTSGGWVYYNNGTVCQRMF